MSRRSGDDLPYRLPTSGNRDRLTRSVLDRHLWIDSRADDRGFVHPPGRLRQMFADPNAGHRRGDRPEFAANADRGIGFEIPHVLGDCTPAEEAKDDALRFPGA